MTTLDNTKTWEAAWTRYIAALKRLDAAKGNPDGRVAAAARRSVRAAKWNLECVGLNIENEAAEARHCREEAKDMAEREGRWLDNGAVGGAGY